MTYPSGGLYPSTSLFPSGQAIGPDTSGNPTGYDESAWWGGVDNSRPDALQWLAVDLLTGTIICDLPGIVSSDPLKRTLGRYESLTAKLVVTDGTSPAWLTGTRPFASALIAYRGQPGSEVIYWGGVVLRRQRPHGGNLVSLTLATPECYLDRRYTGAYSTDPSGIGATADQNTVVSTLVSNFAVASQGMPFTVTVVGAAGSQILAEYNDFDDKTVYSNITALAGLVNGPEWTAHWQWNRATNRITPTLFVGSRIGSATPAALSAPRAVFDSANLISAAVDENYSAGSGANVVTATSSGQGLSRPQATSTGVTFRGRPRVEYRYSPTTSIRDPLTLQQHADRALTLIGDGMVTLTLRSTTTVGPQYGTDWDMGDDIGYVLTGPLFPGDYVGTGRAIGYEADDYYTSPVLYAPAII